MYPFIETIRIENGQIQNIGYHTERFNRTRAAFWNDVTPIDLLQVLNPPTIPGTQKCRILYRKDIEEITYASYQMRKVATLRLIHADNIDYTYKSADREELNTLFSKREEADDILIIRNGLLTDTSIANVALYDGSHWCTPAHPLLLGTKRAELLHKQFLIEKDIHIFQLGDYSQIMLFNAMIDWEGILIPIQKSNFVL